MSENRSYLKLSSSQKSVRATPVLGIANYNHRFVVNYADYVAPLFLLRKKGSKWHWSSESQKALEKLREKFAISTHLVHFIQPGETLQYTLHSDASGRAIVSVLIQTNRDGETHIVSTASQVLTQTERRYSFAEQELLAIVFA